MTRTAIPSVSSTLATLGQPRLLELFRLFGVAAQTDGVAKTERNIEVGVLVEDPVFASGLARQWMGLVECRAVAAWVAAG